MANYIRKFDTTADYEAATLVRPAVSLIETSGEIKFDPDVYNGQVRVYYQIDDASNEVVLYNGGSSDSSASESTSEGGGVTPIDMWIDGELVAVVNTYRFDTAGLHYIDYDFDDTDIPEGMFNDNELIVKVVFSSDVSYIHNAFSGCTNLAELICKRTVPPTLDMPNMFDYATAIYVPASVVNTYKEDGAWSDYYSIIQAM